MADLVLAIGTSHSPMLNSLAEDHVRHAEIDQGKSDWNRPLLDKNGRPATYDELLSRADPHIADLIAEDIIAGRLTMGRGKSKRSGLPRCAIRAMWGPPG